MKQHSFGAVHYFIRNGRLVGKNKSQEASNLSSVEKVRQLMKPYVKGSYVNVPDQNIEKFGKAYYGSNFARLREIKAKYDPDNLFRFPQSIPPSC